VTVMPAPTPAELAEVPRSFALACKAYRERTGADLRMAIAAFGSCACGHRGHFGFCKVTGCPCRMFRVRS